MTPMPRLPRRASWLVATLAAVGLAGCGSSDDDAPAAPAPTDPPATPADPPAAPSPTALFVLGDSLSDVGNAAAAASALLGQGAGLCHPLAALTGEDCSDLFYRKSRVSDGPVAVEHLAGALGLPELTPSLHIVPNRDGAGTNYAVASAKAAGAAIEDFSSQIDVLVLDHGPLLPTDALYVVIIGGNDEIDALQAVVRSNAPAGAATAEETVAAAVEAIADGVARLVDHGAQNVIVANVPSLAVLPAVNAEAQATATVAVLEAASAVTASFNRQLETALRQVELDRPGKRIKRFDLDRALRDVLDAASAAGVNDTDACFDSEAYRDSVTGERTYHEDCAPAAAGESPRFASMVFWDGIHPTGATHAALGQELVDAYRAP